MATILIVESDRAEAVRLRHRLEGCGFTVRHVATAFEALTLIERERPQLVLSRWNAGEMTARELFSALRSDDTVAPFKAVLILEPGMRAEAILVNGTFDLMVAAEELDAIDAKLRRLLHGHRDAVNGSGETSDDRFSISGFFGLLDLAGLMQTICSRRKIGRLELVCGGHQGNVSFEAGKVRHAGYRGSEGKRAFARLFAELRDSRPAPFTFEPMTLTQIADTPCTIDESAQVLLFELAVEQDEGRRHSTVQETKPIADSRMVASGQDLRH